MFGRNLLIATIALLSSAAACATVLPEFVPQTDDERARSIWADQCEDWDEWNAPARAFRVFGNTWYIGTCGISVILVDSGEGVVIIDAGPEDAFTTIRQNIGRSGFEFADVKLLLQSHEHFDHVAGLAEIQRRSGARLIASQAASSVIASGEAAPDDPQFGSLSTFTPARVDGVLGDGMSVTLGGLTLKAIATPGHTPGALSWQWESCDEVGHCKTIVYADSLSPVSADGYRFSDHPEYVQAYRDGLARLASLDCDILLTPHPSASGMRDRLIAGDLSGGPNCAEYAASIEARLNARLTQETETKP